MGNDGRLRWLLGCLAAVLVVRFAFLPWGEWFTEQRTRLEVLTDRLERSNAVLRNRERIVSTLAKHEELIAVARGPFPVESIVTDYKIKVQQSIGAIVGRSSSNNVQTFEWIFEGKAEAQSLRYLRARITIVGTSRALSDAHAALEGEYPNMVVRELSFNATGFGVGDPDGAGQTLTLVSDFFFRAPDSSAQ